MPNIAVKRIYEDYAQNDGFRVLTDRIWPRGMTKEHAHIDLWLKEIAPTTELRQWFHHQEDTPESYLSFCQRYRQELDCNPDPVNVVLQHCADGPVTLLFSARNTTHNQAVFLKDYLEAHVRVSTKAP